MCFSQKSSFVAFVVAWLIGFYLVYRNRGTDRWNGIFIITFTTIQLFEGLIWKSIDESNMGLNKSITSLILIALLAQPLVQTIGGLTWGNDVGVFGINKNLLKILFLLLVIVFVFGIFRTISGVQGDHYVSEVGSKGHLIWKDNRTPTKTIMGYPIVIIIYLFGLLFPLLYQSKVNATILISIGVITALYSLLQTRGIEFSSYWCFTAVIYAFVCLFLN